MVPSDQVLVPIIRVFRVKITEGNKCVTRLSNDECYWVKEEGGNVTSNVYCANRNILSMNVHQITKRFIRSGFSKSVSNKRFITSMKN